MKKAEVVKKRKIAADELKAKQKVAREDTEMDCNEIPDYEETDVCTETKVYRSQSEQTVLVTQEVQSRTCSSISQEIFSPSALALIPPGYTGQ